MDGELYWQWAPSGLLQQDAITMVKVVYSTTEKECLPIKLTFQVYLIGISFTVQTDYQTLGLEGWQRKTHKVKSGSAAV